MGVPGSPEGPAGGRQPRARVGFRPGGSQAGVGPASRHRRPALAAGHEGPGRTDGGPPRAHATGDKAGTGRHTGHRVRRPAAPVGARPRGRGSAGPGHPERAGRLGLGRVRGQRRCRGPRLGLPVPAGRRAPPAALRGPPGPRRPGQRTVAGSSGAGARVPGRPQRQRSGPFRCRPRPPSDDGPDHPRTALFPAPPGSLQRRAGRRGRRTGCPASPARASSGRCRQRTPDCLRLFGRHPHPRRCRRADPGLLPHLPFDAGHGPPPARLAVGVPRPGPRAAGAAAPGHRAPSPLAAEHSFPGVPRSRPPALPPARDEPALRRGLRAPPRPAGPARRRPRRPAGAGRDDAPGHREHGLEAEGGVVARPGRVATGRDVAGAGARRTGTGGRARDG